VKFRGRRVDNGEMVYGYYFNFKSTVGDVNKSFIATGGEYSPDMGLRICGLKEVDLATVGEYTELKDNTGKQIYEDDIVRIYRPGIIETLLAVVKFNDGCFDIESISKATLGRDYLKVYTANHAVKVIGNIHDNPELLEGDGVSARAL